MNKNFRVITINGFRGIFAAIFVVFGLISGFVVTPGYLSMKFWNHFISVDYSLPSMNIFQGILLWAILALILYVINNRQPLIGFGSYSGLSPEQIKEVLKKARARDLKTVDLKVNNNDLTPGQIQDENALSSVSNDKIDEDSK